MWKSHSKCICGCVTFISSSSSLFLSILLFCCFHSLVFFFVLKKLLFLDRISRGFSFFSSPYVEMLRCLSLTLILLSRHAVPSSKKVTHRIFVQSDKPREPFYVIIVCSCCFSFFHSTFTFFAFSSGELESEFGILPWDIRYGELKS